MFALAEHFVIAAHLNDRRHFQLQTEKWRLQGVAFGENHFQSEENLLALWVLGQFHNFGAIGNFELRISPWQGMKKNYPTECKGALRTRFRVDADLTTEPSQDFHKARTGNAEIG